MKTCHKCGCLFVWEQNANGKWIPADPMTGKPHWLNCIKPKKHRKAKPRTVVAAARLFEESERRLGHLLGAS